MFVFIECLVMSLLMSLYVLLFMSEGMFVFMFFVLVVVIEMILFVGLCMILVWMNFLEKKMLSSKGFMYMLVFCFYDFLLGFFVVSLCDFLV